MTSVPFSEDDLHELYTWVDEIPMSRPKRNIARDFADGCSVAEILKFFFPKLVDLHNYVPAMSRTKKLDNWNTLNAKVLRKLYFEVPQEEVEDIIAAVPGAIERFLRALRVKVTQIKVRREELRPSGEMPMYEEAPYVDPPPPTSRRGSTGANGVGRSAAAPRSSRRSTAVSPPTASSHQFQAADAPVSPPAKQLSRPQQPTASPADDAAALRRQVRDKEYTIQELRETVSILSEKIVKLEELVRVKDEKLNQYRQKFGGMQS